MTDPADRHLEERLHSLARGVSVPVVPADDDVRRGRRRLFRMRVAMAGATTGTLAVVLGVTSLTAGDPKATELDPVTTPSSGSTTPGSTPSASEDQPVAPGSSDVGAGNTGKVDLGGDPGAQGFDQGDDPAKGATNGVPPGTSTQGGGTDTATGTDPGSGTATHHGPTSTHGSDPTDVPSSTVLPSAAPTTAPTGTPTDLPTTTPTTTPTTVPTVPPTQTAKVRVHKVLRYYNQVLAERLDPDRVHLQPYDRRVDTKETRKLNGRLYALGSTYRWEDGRSRSGLQITISSGWDQAGWLCGASFASWDCHVPDSIGSTAASGTAPPEVAVHDGVRQVAVEHASGQVVVLTADPTYDSRSRTNADVASTEAELVAAASDTRLILPGVAPVSPRRIDLDAFVGSGLTALVKPGETFQQTGVSRSPWVRGTWSVGGTARGTLAWTVEPIYSNGRFTCLTSYRSCSEVTVDAVGTTVHLARLKKRAGGGWLVQYDGGAYGVRVYSSDKKFPKKRAYAFVTQLTWQPTR